MVVASTKEITWADSLLPLGNGLSSIEGVTRRWKLYEMQTAIQEKSCYRAVASAALLPIGALDAAERNLSHRIDLCREIADEFNEAVAHQE